MACHSNGLFLIHITARRPCVEDFMGQCRKWHPSHQPTQWHMVTYIYMRKFWEISFSSVARKKGRIKDNGEYQLALPV